MARFLALSTTWTLAALVFGGAAPALSRALEQRADRRAAMDAVDRPRQERRDRSDLQPFEPLLGTDRDRVGHHDLLDRRLGELLRRAAAQHAVRRAEDHALGAELLHRLRGLGDRARGRDHVVDDDDVAALDLADQVL